MSVASGGDRCRRPARRPAPVFRRGAGAARHGGTTRVGDARASAMRCALLASSMHGGAVRAGASRSPLRAVPVDTTVQRHRPRTRWRLGMEVGEGSRARRGVSAACVQVVSRWRDVARPGDAARMHRARRERRTTQKSLRTFAHLHLCDAGTACGREIFFQLTDRLACIAAVPVDASPMPARKAIAAACRCRKHGNFPAFFACAVFLAASASAIGGVGKAASAACGVGGARAIEKKIA